MALTMLGHMFSALPELRAQPTQKRIRVFAGDVLVADTTRAMLVWEPRRIVAQYAVPLADLRVPYESFVGGTPEEMASVRMGDGPPVLQPGNFRLHTTPGAELTIGTAAGAGFRPNEPQLADYAVLDWNAFDAWLEEDDRLFAHPRDPFHRVDVRRSSRSVRISADGAVLAESSTPTLLFETGLPTRYYFRREDVAADLVPTGTTTACAYKGEASYYSVGSLTDIAWTYEKPLWDCPGIEGLVAFFTERQVDVDLDGVRLERPVTPWS
ncbi:MAG: DUF427 domain-containing protein [Jatrophihabitans sp.]|uniref:DUF427 domain-containing protein n=1 Tax=Jatrophihabitans sp. TaxID=1932789 RepID=UPI0039122F01